ncbi:Prephenate dehydratase-domain-containing protein [Dendryphion nanum]|uniref:prephenate dehydratase n=1 Tax=Dendryphion nanum TaxID=256645 RepID=A0A9P9IJC5_9PLEO|nr:Prephenate dehydratase-domain-containing protein [Dendryphion nanum]
MSVNGLRDRNGEGNTVVAFLGPEATYTHQATLSLFPSSTYTLLPQHTIADVFTSVQTGIAHRGVVPFENSTNGSVVFTLDLFADPSSTHPDILVSGEVYVSVHHCLVGHAQPTLPSTPEKGTKFPEIKKLYSHPQAWGQCTSFLNANFKGTERQDVSSTSRAAELVAQDPTRSSAAVSSALAAKMHGLEVLAPGIEDRADNTTRFFVIRKKSPHQSSAPPSPSNPPTLSTSPSTSKTLLSFTVCHTNPGALAQSLSVFARHGINLTSINTRPSGVQKWNYIFFVEIQGSRGEEGVENALRDLEGVCRGWRWLGSWGEGDDREELGWVGLGWLVGGDGKHGDYELSSIDAFAEEGSCRQ